MLLFFPIRSHFTLDGDPASSSCVHSWCLLLQFCETEGRGLLEVFLRRKGSSVMRKSQGLATLVVAATLLSLSSTAFAETVASVAGPTVAPSSATPTQKPSSAPSIVTPPPSMAPRSNTTDPPSVAPSFRPTPVPVTSPPTEAPITLAPTSEVSPQPHPTSIGKMIARSIGWLIFLALSVLCFGALMSNRYRIFYFFRGVWYSFLRLECTRWIIRKVRFGSNGPGTNASLNEIIFDQNDLSEGLLLRDTT